MSPIHFPEANRTFSPPEGLDETQCGKIAAYTGQLVGGNCDGLPIIITAWKPTLEEVADIVGGKSVYVSFYSGGLPPHSVSVGFPFSSREENKEG